MESRGVLEEGSQNEMEGAFVYVHVFVIVVSFC